MTIEEEQKAKPETGSFSWRRLGVILLRLCLFLVVAGGGVVLFAGIQASGGSYKSLGRLIVMGTVGGWVFVFGLPLLILERYLNRGLKKAIQEPSAEQDNQT